MPASKLWFFSAQDDGPLAVNYSTGDDMPYQTHEVIAIGHVDKEDTSKKTDSVKVIPCINIPPHATGVNA